MTEQRHPSRIRGLNAPLPSSVEKPRRDLPKVFGSAISFLTGRRYLQELYVYSTNRNAFLPECVRDRVFEHYGVACRWIPSSKLQSQPANHREELLLGLSLSFSGYRPHLGKLAVGFTHIHPANVPTSSQRFLQHAYPREQPASLSAAPFATIARTLSSPQPDSSPASLRAELLSEQTAKTQDFD
jgi:hypothetical protein